MNNDFSTPGILPFTLGKPGTLLCNISLKRYTKGVIDMNTVYRERIDIPSNVIRIILVFIQNFKATSSDYSSCQ